MTHKVVCILVSYNKLYTTYGSFSSLQTECSIQSFIGHGLLRFLTEAVHLVTLFYKRAGKVLRKQ